MYEVWTDLFPGIEECIHSNLTVRDYCTEQGLINTFCQALIPTPYSQKLWWKWRSHCFSKRASSMTLVALISKCQHPEFRVEKTKSNIVVK